MASAGTIEVDIRANSARFVRDMSRARKSITNIDRSIKRLGRTFAAVFAVGGAGAGVGGVLRMADAFNTANNQIRNAVKTAEEFAAVSKDLARQGVASGVAYADLVRTFRAVARIAPEIGITNRQALELTETISQIGVIGGSGTVELQNGIRQLNQGLAAGVFRAEEFNSIVENLPELAFRLADEFGKTQGQLRQMVIDGQLFSRDVARALLRIGADVRKDFEAIPPTLQRAGGSLSTAIGEFASALDSTLGLTKAIAESLTDWAKNIRGATEELGETEARASGRRGRNARNASAGSRTFTEVLFDFFGITAGEGVSRARRRGSGFRRPAAPETPSGPDVLAAPQGRAPPGIRPGVTFTTGSNPAEGFADFLNTLESEAAFSQIDQLTKSIVESANESGEAWKRFSQGFEQLFAQNMVQAAEGSFDAILKSWALTLQQMVAQLLASQIFQFLGGTGVGQALAGAFGGARADGGPVSSGKAYLVGERGPEMFVPGSSGNIIPNGGGASLVYSPQYNISGGVDAQRLVPILEAQNERTKAEVMDMLRRRGR